MPKKREENQKSDWELEAGFDVELTLEDLLTQAPFRSASDDNGQSFTEAARIPSWLHRRVIKLKEQNSSVYEINSDVVRDAFYIGIQILCMRYKTSKDWATERRLAAVVDQTGVSKRIRDQIDTLSKGLEDLYHSGDEEQAITRLVEYVITVSELDNEWLRLKILSLLRNNRLIVEIASHTPKGVQELLLEKKEKK